MGSELPKKRASSSVDDNPAKRQRTGSSTSRPVEAQVANDTAIKIDGPPNFNAQNRLELERVIVLTLNHIGFDSASPEALESMIHMAETYFESLIEVVKGFANGSRRNQVIPTDFEEALKHFNVNPTALKPHKKPPIPKAKLQVTHDTQMFLDGETMDLPCLDEELSGKADKDAKAYIPKSFPDFPSKHTYKYTPTDVDSVTVLASAVEADGTAKKSVPDWRGDQNKMREAVALQAKQAEEALRKLVRASKMASLKDLRSTAERNPVSKARYDLWEEAMKELLEERGVARGGGDAPREEVADHSMIVNAQKKYHRREIPRSQKRMGDAIRGKG